MGNSDHSNPRSREARDLADRRRAAVARLRPRPDRQAAGRELPSARRASSRRRSTRGPAARRGPGRATRVSEWFISGTQPGGEHAGRSARPPVHRVLRRLAGRPGQGRARAERPGTRDVANWLARARRGVGVGGQFDTRTAYFWGRTGWGGPLLGTCAPTPKPKDTKPRQGRRRWRRPGGGGGGPGRADAASAPPRPRREPP